MIRTSRRSRNDDARCRRSSALVLLLLAAPGARGQTTGDVVGLVVDAATKAPVPNLSVRAFSPALPAGQGTTTDETGWYRLSRLPPGSYVLVYGPSVDFRSEVWGMDVRAGATLRRNTEPCPVVACCLRVVIPDGLHPSDSLVARGVDAVLDAVRRAAAW